VRAKVVAVGSKVVVMAKVVAMAKVAAKAPGTPAEVGGHFSLSLERSVAHFRTMTILLLHLPMKLPW
jgi:hypothetical protein